MKTRCCGALHAHAGERPDAIRLAKRNIEAFEATALDAIVVDAAGCGAHLKAYGHLLHDDAAWAERGAAGLGELLKHLAEHPDEGRFAIVEVLAAGPKALARRDAALRQFTGFLDAGRAETSVELPGITSLSLAGGINELLYSEILHGASARLPSRLPDLMFWITLPFLGPEGATEERERVRLSMLGS